MEVLINFDDWKRKQKNKKRNRLFIGFILILTPVVVLMLDNYGIYYIKSDSQGFLVLGLIPFGIIIIVSSFFIKTTKTKFEEFISKSRNNNVNTPKKEEKVIYAPKSEEEALYAILLKFASIDHKVTENEFKIIKASMKVYLEDRFSEDIMLKFDFKPILKTDNYSIIDNCINHISNKVRLILCVCYLLYEDGNINDDEMNLLKYLTNKSNINENELTQIIDTVVESYNSTKE